MLMRERYQSTGVVRTTGSSEVVKRRSVRTSANAINRRSWPLAPGSIRQQLKDRERQDQLVELLNRYSANGLPPLPELLALGKPKFDDTLLLLEPHWREIVEGHEGMTKKQQEQQEAVWEMLQTEVSYIKQIRVIIDVFQNCLINVQQESFLNEIETEKLFSNIDSVYECNFLFWQQYLLPVLQQGRESRQPLDPLIFKEGFVDHFPIMFQVYFKYFIEHKSCLDYAKTCMESSDLFKTFITWGETQKQCNRLTMASMLVSPMQRLLKYSLLLQAILRHTENETDREDIKEMIESVDRLCWAANTSLRRREDYEKLEAIRKTIDPYDAIEAPNDECAKIIQEYNGNFNLLAPMPGFRDGQPRSLLFQSSLRMKEAQNAKMDVDCLLFTDLLLICKSNRKMDRFKIIRPPMRLDQLVVNELRDRGSFLLIHMNEYHVPISAFTFHSDVGAIRGWLDKFREAQKEFKMRRFQETAEIERLRNAGPATEVVEYTPLHPSVSELALPAFSNFPRSESVESADRFIPNLTPHGETVGGGLGVPHSELGKSISTGDIVHNQVPGGIVSNQSSGSHMSPSGMMVGSKHRPVQTCRSVPNITVKDNGRNNNNKLSNSTMSTVSSPNQSSTRHRFSADESSNSTATINPTSMISDSSLGLVEPNNQNCSSSQVSLSERSVFDEEDLSKLKLNARRSSRNEKRYHTADAIQDMKNQDKDSSIHKRLSWRTDVNVDNRSLSSKVLSTDSVRSLPSSSGVSSTGSLHLNPESDISEEVEGRLGRDLTGSRPSSGNNNSRSDPHHPKLFSVGDAEDDDDDDNANENGTKNNRHLRTDSNEDSELSPDSKQSKSKSTPDLVTMFNSQLHVSEMEDGIASVEVTADGVRRKLTHADIVKMKKLKHQVLYDANIESSEV